MSFDTAKTLGMVDATHSTVNGFCENNKRYNREQTHLHSVRLRCDLNIDGIKMSIDLIPFVGANKM